MIKNKILVSSDHHANWEILEKHFEYANQNNMSFIINGDIVGDYNFEELVKGLNLKFPNEIETEEFQKKLSKEEFEYLITYNQIEQNGGDYEPFLKQIPQNLQEQARENIKKIIEYVKSLEFQEKIKEIDEYLNTKLKPIISENKIKIRALYELIIKEHAKILANLIDKYKVKTYFLCGNHEPIYFCNLVNDFLENKDLFVDLGSVKGVCDISGILVAGVSNVNALMPFLREIYSEKELDSMFSHQRGSKRAILYQNISKEILEQNFHVLESDFDWIRINNKNLDFSQLKIDVFITHGQIGQGAWRETRKSNEVPTLFIAAILSKISQITIDGHLHTTHEMNNVLGKKTLRAVGNSAYILEKDESEKIKYEKVKFDLNYDHRGSYQFDKNFDVEKEILNHIWKN